MAFNRRGGIQPRTTGSSGARLQNNSGQSNRGVSRLPTAVQQAAGGFLRVLTPIVNTVNRIVQAFTGGRGALSQYARVVTALVNRVHQTITGQPVGVQNSSQVGEPTNPNVSDTPETHRTDLAATNEDDSWDRIERLRAERAREAQLAPLTQDEFADLTDDWHIDPSTIEAVRDFLDYAIGSGYTDRSDEPELAALAQLVQLTLGEQYDTYNAIRLLRDSGALDGRGFSQFTAEYLIGDFNREFSQDPEGQVTGFEYFIANEISKFVDAGVLSEDVLPYIRPYTDIDYQGTTEGVNIGVMMALYMEALEAVDPTSIGPGYEFDPRNVVTPSDASQMQAAAAYHDYMYNTVVPYYFQSQQRDLYPPDTLTGPFAELVLTAMSFYPKTAPIAAGIEFLRALATGDLLGIATSVVDFLPGPSPDVVDDAAERIIRNADNADRADDMGFVPMPTPSNNFGDLDEGASVISDSLREARSGVYVYDDAGNPLAEFDYIDIESRVLIENKSGTGLEPNAIRTDGTPLWVSEQARQRAIERFAQSQIYNKTKTKLDALTEGNASYTGNPNAQDAALVPDLEEFNSFNSMEIHVDTTDPLVVAAVEAQITNLRQAYPRWNITVVFGTQS